MSTPHLSPRRRASALVVATLALVVVGAGCGGDDSEPAQTGEPASSTTGSDPAPAPEVLEVLVTNDDGYAAEGIDAVVEALTAVEGVEVTVVAPLEGRSGSGGTFTEGEVATEEQTTAGGYDAVAVDGYPSDAVRVALDEMDLTPDLVVSGINEGQNLGPAIDASGTVGAARAAVARGVPAVAISSGAPGFDYDAAVEVLVEWVEDNREALVAGDAPVEVVGVNVPSCTEGEVRGVAEVPAATEGDAGTAQDCTSTLEDPVDDVEAFANGFASLSVLPAEPEVAPTPG